MPRDLTAVAKEDTLQGMPELTKSPEEVEDRPTPGEETGDRSAAMDAMDDDDDLEARFAQQGKSNTKRDELHPYTQALSTSDVESCTRLEEECFPPNERCTREKVRGFSMLHSPRHIVPLTCRCHTA